MDKLPAPSWRKKSENAWVTDLGGDRPEIMLVRLSREEAREFYEGDEDKKIKLLDALHVLKKGLNKVVIRNFPPVNRKSQEKKSVPPPGGTAELIVIHSVTSASIVIPV